MGTTVRTLEPRGFKRFFRRPQPRTVRSRDVAEMRRVRLFVEWLEDRSTPSATTLAGFDAVDLHWLSQQQLSSLHSDIYQSRELIASCGVTSYLDHEDAALAAAFAAPRHEVIFIDARVPDMANFVAQLEEGLPPGTWYDLYTIDATSGGVAQISEILSRYHHELDAVHLFTHGSAGELMVGADILDLNQLAANAGQIAGWRDALNDYGDLLLYGCDVAAGAEGQAFVEQLHHLVGVDVAASTNDTGSSHLGGDWILETHLGEIGAAPLHLADTADAWSGLLNTYTVLNTNDSGFGSFRQAILNANANAGLDTIRFAIIGLGPQVIRPDTQLPDITDAVVIDGSTQLGYADHPLIVIDGVNTTGNGLVLAANDSTIRGLNFIHWSNDGLQILGDNNTIAGVFSGIDATGTFAQANQGDGLKLGSGATGNIIGGTDPLDRNIISGNSGNGIELTNADSNQILGNIIGANAAGTGSVANAQNGVRLWNGSTDNIIGGTGANDGNIIAFNGAAGVLLNGSSTTTNQILGNSIFANAGLGIDLSAAASAGDGVTANDPGDPDSGPNYLKNYPVLSSAITTGTSITIVGSLNSVAVGTYRIEFFANDTADASGHGEGQRYLGFTTVTTDSSGNASFSATFASAVAAGAAISATNTDLSLLVTSEFAANEIAISNNQPPTAVGNSYSVNEDGSLTVAAAGVLANDSDPNSDLLIAQLVAGPTHGTLTLNANGSFSYTPDANYYGSDSFTYQAFDGSAYSNIATVSLTINAVNDAPVAADNAYAIGEDGSLTVSAAAGVLTNDSDAENDPLTAILVSGPTHGSLTLNANGTFTYTPVANYNGLDSFTYRVSDGSALSNVATVSLTINAVNDAPVAADNAYAIGEDGSLTVSAAGVLTNDSDAENDPLTAILVSGPTHGSLTLNANGSFTYTPVANYNGLDSFTYRVSDGSALSNVATVSLTINAVNDAPVAADNAYAIGEDGSLTVSAAGVLTNDTDAENDPLTAILVSGPTHGSLTLNANGSFTYTPVANYNGLDSFTYRVSDGSALSNVATVSLTINAVNDAPVAADNAYAIGEDGSLTVSAVGVLTNDSDAENDPLTAILVSGPTHGSLTLNANGSFTYTPVANYNGLDSFTYRVSDGSALSNVATVSLTINAVNDAPVAADNAYAIGEDGSLTVSAAAGVLTNDSDAENDPLTAILVSGPTHGSLTLNANGSFTYTPVANYNGLDSFTYRVSDGSALSNVATVSLTINAVNDAPVATDNAYAIGEDGSLTVSAAAGVLTNDSDAENDPLTAILVTGPTHGSLTLNANGSFTYTPVANYNGLDSFTYRVSDGSALSNVATVSLTINAVNDAPVAADNAYAIGEDGSLTVSAAAGVLTNDTDAENDPLTAILVTGPTHGSLTLNADGSFTYTPDANYNGPDSFTYRASDGAALSNIATVSLTINAVNDAPTSTDDAYAIGEDGTLIVSTAAGVLANDADIDNNLLTAMLVAGPTHGSLTLNPDGSFTYTPASNYNGPDSFTYRVFDGAAFSNTSTVTLTIASVNDTPVAGGDAYTIAEDGILTIAAAVGVLNNDTDIDSPTLTAVLVSGPAHGSLTLNADGSFTYTPTANYNGPDSFTYQAFDGVSSSPVQTVTLTVAAVNDAPTLIAPAFGLNEDETLTIAVPGLLTGAADLDGDSLAAILAAGPVHGSLILNADGSFTYTPAANFNGADSFSFQVTDGQAVSNIVIARLTVAAVNDAPEPSSGGNDTTQFTLRQGATLTIGASQLIGLATDIDGDPLTVELVEGTAHGTLVRRVDGSFAFTPAADFVGRDQFIIVISDGGLGTRAIVVGLVVEAAVSGTPNNNLPAAPIDYGNFLFANAGGLDNSGRPSDGDGSGVSSLSFGVGGDEEAGSERVVRRVAGNATRGDFASATKAYIQPREAETPVRVEIDRHANDNRASFLIAPSLAQTVPPAARFVAQLWQQQSAQLYQDLDNIAENIAQHTEHRRAEAFIVGGAAAVMSSGYILWNLRTFYVLLGALTARPLWRTFDPLLILDRWEKRRDDDVEKMFD